MSELTAELVVGELCLVRPPAQDATTVLRRLAGLATDAGFVGPRFTQALLDRERDHPTGLPTPVPSAIPHADPEHVLRPGLALALLDPPVPFGEMGSADGVVACRLVVLLLVTDPTAQVAVLQRVVTALASEAVSAVVDDPTVTTGHRLAEAFAACLRAAGGE